MKRTIVCCVAAAIGITPVILYWGRSACDFDKQAITDRIAMLKDLVATQRSLSDQASEDYAPKFQGRINDLSTLVTVLLQQLPGVVAADAPLAPRNPSRRLIHIRDWHFLSKDLFAADLRSAASRPISDIEFDLLYQEHLLQVELVQQEQITMLRCLVKHHGLRRIYKEGFTAEDTAFSDKIEAMKEAHGLQPALKKQLDDVRQMQKQMASAGKENSDRWHKAKAIEKELSGLIDQHATDMLTMGAAVCLLVNGELAEVLPLDDGKLLESAKPVRSDGRVQVDAAKVKDREDGMVRLVLAKDAAAVIILGGSHDLTHSIRAISGELCEYLRLTGHAYRKVSGEK